MLLAADQRISDFTHQGIRVGILAADGPVFCSGSDTKENSASELKELPGRGPVFELIRKMAASRIFWVAAVSGPALGAGLALVTLCPIVIAAEDTWFSMPEIDAGSFPRGVVHLIDGIVGKRQSLALALSGERLTAPAARDANIVTEVVPRDQVDARSQQWAERIRDRPKAIDLGLDAWFRDLRGLDR